MALASCGRPQATTDAEILWDTWGVPHVFAADADGLFRGFGWAQMRAHGDLLLTLIGEARGRGAEYWGESWIESDRWVWTVGIPERAQNWYADQEPEFARHLDAFAAGVNAFGRLHPDELRDDLEVVLPITGADLLAHLQRVLHFSFVSNESLQAGATTPPTDGGSNAWAIAPAHASGARALLLANPHLPWEGRYRLFEAHLECPEYRAYGATLVGFPTLAMAFNDKLGWTHTVNAQDGMDLYALELDGDRYRWDGAWRGLERHPHRLRVRAANGDLREEPIEIRSSVHGPIVSGDSDRALALRVVGLDRPGSARQWWRMGAAGDLASFESATASQQLPLFSILYADVEGNVLHHFGGLTPRRAAGASDPSGLLDGSAPRDLWSEYLGYDELPRVLNPTTGWLQNANDPPWNTTLPAVLDPDDFPQYVAPRRMSLRAQHSAQMLQDDESVSFDELVDYKHSTHVELADRILDDLLPLAAAHGDPTIRRAGEVLAAWDRSVDAGSSGALLFLLLVQALGDETNVFERAWDEHDPLATPRGIASAERVLEALGAAAGQAVESVGALDLPWGDLFRLRADRSDLPCSGGMAGLGIFRSFEFSPDADGRMRVIAGDSFVSAVEFATPPRAQALMTYGNWTQTGSSHRSDQLPLAASQTLREVWFSRTAAQDHLERQEWVPAE
ncbi:penicillin acylase family protein [Engelhardtia mirabilis]|uniref:penicillin acylase family protein n=1 Tax=Engelhardtia mirabilis TaxID=2528011 RepID=UPI003AF3A986